MHPRRSSIRGSSYNSMPSSGKRSKKPPGTKVQSVFAGQRTSRERGRRLCKFFQFFQSSSILESQMMVMTSKSIGCRYWTFFCSSTPSSAGEKVEVETPPTERGFLSKNPGKVKKEQSKVTSFAVFGPTKIGLPTFKERACFL